MIVQSHADALDVVQALLTYGLPALGTIIGYRYVGRRQDRAKQTGEFHETGSHEIVVHDEHGQQRTMRLTGVTSDTGSTVEWMMRTIDRERDHSREQDRTIAEQGEAIERLESKLGRAHAALNRLHAWIAAGKPPPDPERPSWLPKED